MDIKRQTSVTWDYKYNKLSDFTLAGVAGDIDSQQLLVKITGSKDLDLTGYKLAFYYKSLGKDNEGFVFTEDFTGTTFTLDVPNRALCEGTNNYCFTLSNDTVSLGTKVVEMKIANNLVASVTEVANTNRTDFENMFLASLPDDYLTRLEQFKQFIDTKVDKTAIIDIEHGGTNSKNRAGALSSLLTASASGLTSSTNDTFSFWKNSGNGITRFDSMILNGQPYQWGFVETFVNSNTVFQTFYTDTGSKFTRNATNIASTALMPSSWFKIANSANPLSFLGSDSTSTGLAYTITNTNLIDKVVNKGFIFNFIPSITSTSQSTTLSINGSTAYQFGKIDSYTGAVVAVSSSNSPVGFLVNGVTYTLVYTNGFWVILNQPSVNPQSINGIVPTAKGGTNNDSGLASGLQYKDITITSLLKDSTITVPSTSTPNAEFNFKSAPNPSGFPSTSTFNGNIYISSFTGTNMIVTAKASGYTYTSNVAISISGTTITITATPTWFKSLDSNSPSLVVGTDSGSTGSAYTLTSTLMPATLPDGYSFRLIPNVDSTTQTPTFSINGTSYTFSKRSVYNETLTTVSSDNSPTNFLKANVCYVVVVRSKNLILEDFPIIEMQGVSGTLPVANGGTGNATGITQNSYGLTSSTISDFTAFSVTGTVNSTNPSNTFLISYPANTTGAPTTNAGYGFFTFRTGTNAHSSLSVFDLTTNVTYTGYLIVKTQADKAFTANAPVWLNSNEQPVGTVVTTTSSTSSGYTVGTWTSLGSVAVGATAVYYWKRTA